MNESHWDWLRNDAAAFRTQQWEFRHYHSTPALFTRDGSFWRQYHGEDYDPAEWEVREGGWDHEHCHFCNQCICDTDPSHLKAGYTSGEEWLCPTCYQRIIVGGEDPETVLAKPGPL